MPKLVTDDEVQSGNDLQSGNALLSAGAQLAVFVGPALGGAVVATLSAAAGFGLWLRRWCGHSAARLSVIFACAARLR